MADTNFIKLGFWFIIRPNKLEYLFKHSEYYFYRAVQ